MASIRRSFAPMRRGMRDSSFSSISFINGLTRYAMTKPTISGDSVPIRRERNAITVSRLSTAKTPSEATAIITQIYAVSDEYLFFSVEFLLFFIISVQLSPAKASLSRAAARSVRKFKSSAVQHYRFVIVLMGYERT